jgi:tetratricopeptide (TPR) repeat protein
MNYAWLTVLNASPEAAPYYPKALKMAEEACRIVPDDGLSLIILGAAQYRAGKDREAIETFKRADRLPYWIERVTSSPTIGFLDNQFRALTKDKRNLPSLAFQVLAYLRAGESQETFKAWEQLKSLRTALQLKPRSPIEQLIDEVERELAKLGDADPRRTALDARLAAIFGGDQKLQDNRERLELAQSAYDNARHVAAARLWSGAVEADPKAGENRQTQILYNAACAAALAGCGLGKDNPAPDHSAKTRLREQALGWLQAELAVWTELVENGPATGRPFIVGTLKHWQVDTDLAGIREAKALEALPEVERKTWRALWAEVDALLKRVQEQAP